MPRTDELDEFTRAYVETALWSSTDGDDVPLDKDHSAADIDDDSLAAMIADCRKFQDDNRALIQKAIDSGAVKSGPDYGPWARAGHDFWLTRNGAGAGFWDGDWPEEDGAKLTEAAKAFRECYLSCCPGGTVTLC